MIGHSDINVGTGPQRTGSAAASTLLDSPTRVVLSPAVDIERISFLEVRDRERRQVVCAIEVLSPTNKNTGVDREQYLAKRLQYLNSSVHFVEIDLLRGGPRMPVQDPPECDYCVLVSRIEERPGAAFWPLRLPDRLPTIPVPLLPGDVPAQLDLQAALNRVYDEAGYQYYIYNSTPEPKLTTDQLDSAARICAATEFSVKGARKACSERELTRRAGRSSPSRSAPWLRR